MPTWPADHVERWPIARLVPYARNARQHAPAQIAQLAASIREWGWTIPVLADEEGGIIAGHGRVLAAQQLGLGEVPVMIARGWSEAQRRSYVLADNQLTLNATWDEQLLGIELADLRTLGADLNLIGFSGDELVALMSPRGAGLTDPDEVPPVPETPVTRAGEVWILGNHRLACGDCRLPEVVRLVLAGSTPHLMVTDPPYGVDYDAAWRNRVLAQNSRAIGAVENDDIADWTEAWRLFPGSVAYVWHGGLHAGVVQGSLSNVRFVVRAQIVWVKQRPVISRGNYHWQHEPLLYAVKEGEAAQWHGGRKQSTVWHIEHVRSDTSHSTQKPVECMRRPIENNSVRGQLVYDPFLGSGTTLIAAEMTTRCCRAIELNPAYCDVAVQRWQAYTGRAAVLEGDGRPFDEMLLERAGKVATPAEAAPTAARRPGRRQRQPVVSHADGPL